jgi:hypothetical protein
MVITENLYVVASCGAADGKCAVVVNVPVVESPGQRDCIGTQWSNHVGARRQVLGIADANGGAHLKMKAAAQPEEREVT